MVVNGCDERFLLKIVTNKLHTITAHSERTNFMYEWFLKAGIQTADEEITFLLWNQNIK
jgi:hypothetical protein